MLEEIFSFGVKKWKPLAWTLAHQYLVFMLIYPLPLKHWVEMHTYWKLYIRFHLFSLRCNIWVPIHLVRPLNSSCNWMLNSYCMMMDCLYTRQLQHVMHAQPGCCFTGEFEKLWIRICAKLASLKWQDFFISA